MPIREYIGARYVPKFFDDGNGGSQWTNTVSYEPLTIVLYEGNSYTSKQFVPIGVAITNGTYWAETGNYNSQVEQYRQEVLGFSDRIDAAVSLAESATSFDKLNKIGAYVAPQYIGDNISDESGSCCCHVGTHFYLVCNNDYNGEGTIYCYDTIGNELSATYSRKKVGHANSICYDSIRDCFWIAPNNEYNDGVVTTRITKLYKYNNDFSLLTEVDIPVYAHGVSFDSATNTVWFYSPTRGGPTIDFYKMGNEDTEFSYFCTVANPFETMSDAPAHQDMTVYDNVCLISDTKGTVYVGAIGDDSITWGNSFKVGSIDYADTWTYGECEGFEFDADGHLYMARMFLFGFTNDYGNYWNGTARPVKNNFITELCWNPETVSNFLYGSTTGYKLGTQASLSLTEDTQGLFSLGVTQIRSLNQLACKRVESFTTYIEGEVTEPYRVRFAPFANCKGVCVASDAIYRFPRMEVLTDINLVINSSGRIIQTDSESDAISVYYQRCATIHYGGAGTFTKAGSCHINSAKGLYAPLPVFIGKGSGNIVVNNLTVAMSSDTSHFKIVIGDTLIEST